MLVILVTLYLFAHLPDLFIIIIIIIIIRIIINLYFRLQPIDTHIYKYKYSMAKYTRLNHRFPS